jgi:hypothetical protein
MANADIETLAKNFEAERKVAAKKFLIFFFVGLGLMILGVVSLVVMAINDGNNTAKVFQAIGLISLIVGIVLFSIAFLVKSHFKKTLLSVVEEKVLTTLFPVRTVDPHRGLVLRSVLAPGFFASPDRYLGADFMSSTYDGIPFEKASYTLQRMETRSDGKHTYTEYVTYAEGTMYHFTFERNFGQIVKVLEKSGIATFGSQGLTKVETEYILFNKKFKVLASDETTVFYLLTPQIQEKIMELEGTFSGHFFMAFIGNELYIAVDDSHSSLNVSLLKPITVEVMTHIYAVYAIPKVFIELLGLNKNKFKKDAGGTNPA